MISIKCPYCQVGLKVDEGKLPLGLTSFKCPKCRQAIPVSLVLDKKTESEEPDTVLVNPLVEKRGRIMVPLLKPRSNPSFFRKEFQS